MKKTLNFLGGCLWIVLIPFTYIANKISDLRSKEPPPESIRHSKKTTTYPDGIYHEYSTEEFNKWAAYIHNQLN